MPRIYPRDHVVWRLVLLAIFTMLSACAQLGLPHAEKFGERLAVGYGTAAAVRDAARALLVANRITADDAENIQKQADSVRAGLDVARSLAKTDLAAATDRLTAAMAVLQALQTYLQSRQAASTLQPPKGAPA